MMIDPLLWVAVPLLVYIYRLDIKLKELNCERRYLLKNVADITNSDPGANLIPELICKLRPYCFNRI